MRARITDRVRVAVGTLLLLVLGGCSLVDPAPENDRVAEVVATALGTPRPISAGSLQRHIASLPAGRDGRVVVIEAEDLDPAEVTDPIARLRWRVRIEQTSNWGAVEQPPKVTCYDVAFSVYGAVGRPDRVRCPEGAAALDPPPAPPGEPPLGWPVPICRSGSGDCPGG